MCPSLKYLPIPTTGFERDDILVKVLTMVDYSCRHAEETLLAGHVEGGVTRNSFVGASIA